jgi:hypothetical protein
MIKKELRTKHIIVQVESDGLQLFGMISDQIVDVESGAQQSKFFRCPPSESNSVLQFDFQLGESQCEFQVG